MKKVFFLLFIAIASIAMVSCEEPDIEANQVVFNGEVYKVSPKIFYSDMLVGFEQYDSLFSFLIRIHYPAESHDISTIEGEYDLTQRLETGGYSLDFSIRPHYKFSFYNTKKDYNGFFARTNEDGDTWWSKSYENESLFKSGTMIVDEEDGMLTLIIKDAELQNGKKLSVWFNIPSQEEQN